MPIMDFLNEVSPSANQMPWTPSPGGETTIPRSIIDQYGGYGNMLARYQDYNPRLRADAWLADLAGAEQLGAATAGWEEGLGTLGGARDRILDDPNFNAAMASLGEMAGGDYDAIGEVERAGLTGQLASGVNRAQSDRAAALRRAGLSGSGMDIENAPLYSAIGSGALADVNAQVEIANQQARDAATQQMGQMSLQQQGLLQPLDMAVAGLQTDVPISGYDPLVMAGLDWTMDQQDWSNQQYEDAVAREEEEFAAWEAAQPMAWAPDWLQGIVNAGTDIANLFLPFEDTGAFRQMPSFMVPGG